MSEERRRNARLIIRAAAAASAGVAAVLSKRSILGALLKADTPVLTAIAVGMVMALGRLFNQNVGSSEAIAILSKYIGSGLGIAGAKSIVGWIPILGNAANATLTFGFMEALGWQIYDHFDQEHEDKISGPRKSAKAWRIPVSENIPVTKKIRIM